MGNAISALLGAFKTIKIAITVLRDLSTKYNALLARANAAPGLPVASPTAPYWLEDPPFPELPDVQSPALPADADVVIIGSGIAGAAAARSVLHEGRRLCQAGRRQHPPRVVVLEARQLCSGATGRNGGHIKASPHETFGRLRKKMPPERAAALVRFQLRHLETLVELCQAEGFDAAECREVETVDLFVSQETLKQAVAEVEDLRRYVPEFQMAVWTASEARERFGANELVVGAVTYAAGALWPYRLVTSVWRNLLDEFPKTLSVETHTAVLAINAIDAERPYAIETERGIISTQHVVHATNAFVPQLVPGLRGKMTGALAHMSAQRPGAKFPDLDGGRSWSIFYGGFGFDYVTQRPSKDGVPGDIMLGGGFGQSVEQGMDRIGLYDDSETDALTVAHILGIMPTIFEPNWGKEAVTKVSKARTVWSGVIAITADFRPFVGRLDERITGRKASGTALTTAHRDSGEWIAAGFIGDGMVWAWLSATALGIMISGTGDEVLPATPGKPGGRLRDWFPEELLPTFERVTQLDMANLADELM